MTTTPRTGGRIEELLERSGRFFTPGEFSDDLRTVTRRGGRASSLYCDSFTKLGNLSFPSAIAFGQTVTCLLSCH